jgi:RNA polymerase sigma-70 factor (ECF subfamily)
MVDNEDLKLVCESRQGSRGSFERLLLRYEKPIFNAAYRILRNYEDAKDVTQIVFLKAFQNLEHFDAKHRFFSWIYRIALNESINLSKSRRRFDVAEDNRGEVRNTPENLLSRKELGGVVEAALMSLEFEYRVVIVLRHFNDCSYEEMGEILELPEKTVKSRLFTARTLLREILSGKRIL